MQLNSLFLLLLVLLLVLLLLSMLFSVNVVLIAVAAAGLRAQRWPDSYRVWCLFFSSKISNSDFVLVIASVVSIFVAAGVVCSFDAVLDESVPERSILLLLILFASRLIVSSNIFVFMFVA